MKYSDLREFMANLEAGGQLRRIARPVSPNLEITEVSDRVLRKSGPALLFEQPTGFTVPVLANLFGTPQRVALAMGAADVSALRDVGELLANLKEPEAPSGFKDALSKVSMLKAALWDMAPKAVSGAPCQQVVMEASDVDLASLPIQTC